MEVVKEIIEHKGKSLTHIYTDDSSVVYVIEKAGEYLAPMSKVSDEQYKASQRYAPEDTFLLEIFA